MVTATTSRPGAPSLHPADAAPPRLDASALANARAVSAAHADAAAALGALRWLLASPGGRGETSHLGRAPARGGGSSA